MSGNRLVGVERSELWKPAAGDPCCGVQTLRSVDQPWLICYYERVSSASRVKRRRAASHDAAPRAKRLTDVTVSVAQSTAS